MKNHAPKTLKKAKLNQISKRIDYSGCNPKIAKFLKKYGGRRGILCRGRFGDEDFVVAYIKDDLFPYKAMKDKFIEATPVKKCKKRKKIIKVIDEGYALD